jgi:hypothetical protein
VICIQRFTLKEIINVEVEQQYQVKISKRFADFENLDDDDDDDDVDDNDNADIERTSEIIREIIKFSATYNLIY